MMDQNTAAKNTDREIWREREGDYYAPAIHVTEGGGIGIDVGGTVFVKPVREWHRLASMSQMTPDQIKYMVHRFLGWRLPEDFSPDAGISFKKPFNEHTAHPMKYEPIGTNLFDATQADAMVRYMIEGMPH